MQQIRWPVLLVLVVVGAGILLSFGAQAAKHAMYRNTQEGRAAALQGEITLLRQRQTELHGRIAYLRSDAYIESAAREQLGLIKPGETAVIVVVEERQEPAARTVAPAPSTRDLSYPDRWRDALFGQR